MLRSDKFGYGFLLLGAPLAYFAGGGPIGAILSGVVGFGFLIAGHLDKSEAEPDSLISLGLTVDGPPAPVKKSVPGLQSKVATARLILTPNTVRESETGNLSFVATIRNVPTTSGVRIAEGIRAYLEFIKPGKDIYSGNGAWVNVPQNFTTLKSGEQANLVLVMMEESTSTVLAITNSRSTPLPRVSYSNIERAMVARMRETIHRHVLSDDALTIRVTLTNSHGEWCGTFNFKYEWIDGNIRITPEN
jgi:hypothetical protein